MISVYIKPSGVSSHIVNPLYCLHDGKCLFSTADQRSWDSVSVPDKNTIGSCAWSANGLFLSSDGICVTNTDQHLSLSPENMDNCFFSVVMHQYSLYRRSIAVLQSWKNLMYSSFQPRSASFIWQTALLVLFPHFWYTKSINFSKGQINLEKFRILCRNHCMTHKKIAVVRQ